MAFGKKKKEKEYIPDPEIEAYLDSLEIKEAEKERKRKEREERRKALAGKKPRWLKILEVVLITVGLVCAFIATTLIMSDPGRTKAIVNVDLGNSAMLEEHPMRLALYNYDAVSELTDDNPEDPTPKAFIRIRPNEEMVLTDIVSEGAYTLQVYDLPVLEDGTEFVRPAPQSLFFSGDDIVITFNLEKK